jgi:hypothetical protein
MDQCANSGGRTPVLTGEMPLLLRGENLSFFGTPTMG